MLDNQNYDVNMNKLALSLSNKFLGLVLLPTEKCNFRCTYCYEDYKIGRMVDSTTEAIKNFLQKRTSDPELEYLHIGWFGGEPLIEHDIVFDILSYAKQKCDENNVTLISDMTTNGYLLTKPIFDKLISLNLKHFQVSLDGPKELHDLSRIRADKKGTFDVIWKNLLDMRENKEKFVVILRVHITPENKDHIKKLINQIGDNFPDDPRFKVFIRGISNLGGSKSDSIKIVDKNKQQEIILEMLELLSERHLTPYVLEDKEQGSYICYASSPNQFIIRADGSIAKCTVAFDKEINRVGQVNADGTLDVDQEKFNFWVRGLKTIDKKSLRCPFFSSKLCSDIKCQTAGEEDKI
ncbi:TPA: hypothetical protein DIC20_01685 [Candidatus Dependentiae bacterium]|nr:hypothetical protein [Candidatus Dependentiae bacterium]